MRTGRQALLLTEEAQMPVLQEPPDGVDLTLADYLVLLRDACSEIDPFILGATSDPSINLEPVVRAGNQVISFTNLPRISPTVAGGVAAGCFVYDNGYDKITGTGEYRDAPLHPVIILTIFIIFSPVP